MKITFIMFALALSFATSAFAGFDSPFDAGDEDVTLGVQCKVNAVKVLAKTAEDCAAISGTVVATVQTKTTPVK